MILLESCQCVLAWRVLSYKSNNGKKGDFSNAVRLQCIDYLQQKKKIIIFFSCADCGIPSFHLWFCVLHFYGKFNFNFDVLCTLLFFVEAICTFFVLATKGCVCVCVCVGKSTLLQGNICNPAHV